MTPLSNVKRTIAPHALTQGKAPVRIHGPLFAPDGLLFNPQRDYVYCRICGVIYQPELNRLPNNEYTAEVQLTALNMRREWSFKHARLHPPSQHRLLALSGRHVTPEALQRLVPFGIIPVSDIAFDNESEHAGLEAPRAPTNDVEY
jgi:hypothetical protein